MPRVTFLTTMRHISVWRFVLLILLAYVTIRLVIPWLVDAGIPFWARAAFLAMGPVAGVLLGPWLYPRRR